MAETRSLEKLARVLMVKPPLSVAIVPSVVPSSEIEA